jgi:hypothetical protein
MLLDDDIVANGKAKAGAFSSRFGCEEGVEYLLLHLGRDACAVIPNPEFYPNFVSRLRGLAPASALRFVAA